ncbi:uncharacterized protein LOC113315459 [Papaver somniferum]|uniref:uncharacterized protein LOC113315459 n=1 Tax=Papaver somniferum TaxID=3469 RepID=UPI000E704BD7|nr:uncharacterized protein LOC113315459 [Papaver somniferum]
MLDFNNCIQNCDLIQAPKTGLEFTWSNNKAGKKRIICKLDRSFYNLQCLEAYPSGGYKVGTRGTSDHSPLFGANASLPKPANVPFRALKVWMTHEGFKKNVFGDVKKKILQAEEEVMKLTLISNQYPSNIDILNQLVTTRGVQEVLTQQNQEIEKQKARVKWLKFGAANTKFFHVNMKLRQMHNAILELENGEDNEILEATPTTEEIKYAVFDLDPDSSPGPDGFGGWFYKMAWDIISEDFVNATQYCWEKEFIPAGMNANFLMFLPKVKNARKANQFRPIGLMNFCFKVFTKIITLILSTIVQKIISPQQGAFIKGRNIQDQIVLASEMINELEKKRRGGNMDSYLLKSAKISVLVNGGPVGFFNNGELLPMVYKNGAHPTHIMFADDIFLFCNGDRRKLRRLLKILETYQKASELEINLSKSKCFIGGTSNARKIQLAEDCGMILSTFPDKYLGVMLNPGMIRAKHVWGCVEMLQENSAGWKGKLLSFQERLVLMKFVLCSIPIHNMFVYKWPKKVLKESEKIIRNFLWSGDPSVRKTLTLKWEKTCSPLSEGGLGIIELKDINKSMLMKLCWRIQNGNDECAKLFQGKFQDKNGNWIEYYTKSLIWPGIKWVVDEAFEHTRWLVGDGKNISFWKDTWIKDRPLKDIFP